MTKAVVLTGFAELDKTLGVMEVKLQKKILRQAARDAAKYVAADAKQLAPEDEGRLVSSIKVKARARSRKNRHSIGYAIWAAQGLPYYAAALELGTKERFNKSGASRGMLRGFEFLRPALWGNAAAVKAVFIRSLRSKLRLLK